MRVQTSRPDSCCQQLSPALGQRPRLQSCTTRQTYRISSRAPQKLLAGVNGVDVSPGSDPIAQEKFISISDVLNEAREMGGDGLVFEDDSDEQIWEHESRVAREAYDIDELATMEDFTMDMTPHAVEDPDPVPSSYTPEQGFKEMTVDELWQRLDAGGSNGSSSSSSSVPMFLLDVRQPDEYEEVHVPGAVLVPLDSLSAAVKEGRLDEVRNRPFAVICRSGARSAQACVRLSKVLGFDSPINVQGGTLAWIGAGYSVNRAGQQ